MANQRRVLWQSSLEAKPDYVRAIGMISVENGNLELALADLLAAALSISKRLAHAVYFTPRAAALRVEILQAASKERLAPRNHLGASHPLEVQKAEALRKIMRMTKQALRAMSRRHDVIHDAWGVTPDDDRRPVIRAKTREALSRSAVEVPLHELTSLIRDFRELITNVDELTGEFRRRPPAMADVRSSLTKSGSSARTERAGNPASLKK